MYYLYSRARSDAERGYSGRLVEATTPRTFARLPTANGVSSVRFGDEIVSRLCLLIGQYNLRSDCLFAIHVVSIFPGLSQIVSWGTRWTTGACPRLTPKVPMLTNKNPFSVCLIIVFRFFFSVWIDSEGLGIVGTCSWCPLHPTMQTSVITRKECVWSIDRWPDCKPESLQLPPNNLVSSWMVHFSLSFVCIIMIPIWLNYELHVLFYKRRLQCTKEELLYYSNKERQIADNCANLSKI